MSSSTLSGLAVDNHSGLHWACGSPGLSAGARVVEAIDVEDDVAAGLGFRRVNGPACGQDHNDLSGFWADRARFREVLWNA